MEAGATKRGAVESGIVTGVRWAEAHATSRQIANLMANRRTLQDWFDKPEARDPAFTLSDLTAFAIEPEAPRTKEAAAGFWQRAVPWLNDVLLNNDTFIGHFTMGVVMLRNRQALQHDVTSN